MTVSIVKLHKQECCTVLLSIAVSECLHQARQLQFSIRSVSTWTIVTWWCPIAIGIKWVRDLSRHSSNLAPGANDLHQLSVEAPTLIYRVNRCSPLQHQQHRHLHLMNPINLSKIIRIQQPLRQLIMAVHYCTSNKCSFNSSNCSHICQYRPHLRHSLVVKRNKIWKGRISRSFLHHLRHQLSYLLS